MRSLSVHHVIYHALRQKKEIHKKEQLTFHKHFAQTKQHHQCMHHLHKANFFKILKPEIMKRKKKA